YSPVRHSSRIQKSTHQFATRPESKNHLCKHKIKLGGLVRLACIRHAASVRPEPGSNSHLIDEKLLTSSSN
ncbi:hypothetical protein DY130_04515, partial [Apilactobacillus micheneri]